MLKEKVKELLMAEHHFLKILKLCGSREGSPKQGQLQPVSNTIRSSLQLLRACQTLPQGAQVTG